MVVNGKSEWLPRTDFEITGDQQHSGIWNLHAQLLDVDPSTADSPSVYQESTFDLFDNTPIQFKIINACE